MRASEGGVSKRILCMCVYACVCPHIYYYIGDQSPHSTGRAGPFCWAQGRDYGWRLGLVRVCVCVCVLEGMQWGCTV